jgi:hypothetical protein
VTLVACGARSDEIHSSAAVATASQDRHRR